MKKGEGNQSSSKNLSLMSLVMMNIVAVVSLRGLPAEAEYGLSSIFYYIFAAIMFLIPVSLVAAELASTYPQKGGVFRWVGEAFGPRLAFLAMFLLWSEVTIWFPTALTFGAVSLAFMNPNTVILFWIIPVISCIVMGSIYMKALGYNINIPMIAILLVSIIQVLIGNYLPKCKQNGTVGIRVAWTMKSEKNWNKTHRFAGKLYVLSGFLSIVLSLCGFNHMYIFFIVMISMFLPIAYSFAIRKNI